MLSNATAKTIRWRVLGLVLVCGLIGVSPAWAAEDDGKTATLEQQWADLLHYINIARPKLAASYGQAILNNPAATPKTVYLLSVGKVDSLPTLHRGARLEGMKDVVETLLQKIETGYENWRTDPKQIEESMQMLNRGPRAYALGKQRLQRSGEYAVPLLIQALLDAKTPTGLQEKIVTILEDMGRSAVRPYSVALQAKDLRLVGFLANALGRIGYPGALPRLREALLRPDLQDPDSPTRNVIVSAMIACGGGDPSVLKKAPVELFYALGEQYYDRAGALLPDESAGDDRAFVWFWREGTGLIARPAPKEILCDIYAMRMARLALKYDPTYYPAVPLWLSACLRRELDLPAGQSDPLWRKEQPKAEFYALASSPQYLQMVLVRALADENAPLAERVIATMGKNTGAPSLVKPLADGAMPLVAAMGCADRNVRFLAAETLMLARPTETFFGAETVPALMSEALRQQGKQYALVIVKDPKRRNETIDAVRAAGFEVVEESDPDQLLIAARKEIGLDVVFLGPQIPATSILQTLRREAVYQYLPVVVNSPSIALRDLAARDGKVVLLPDDAIDAAKVAEALKQAITLSAGRVLSSEQASDWAIRAAEAIRTVGQRDNVIYDLRRTTGALTDALKRDDAALQIAAANALAVINTSKAQRAMIDLALSDAGEKVRIAAFRAASRSVRRFGNQATDAQADTLVTLVSKPGSDSQPLLEAAAQLLGTMNLPSEKIPALIESTDTID